MLSEQTGEFSFYLLNMEQVTEVVAAVLFHEGSFLCVQKGLHRFSYLQHTFEFPGGKPEPGESAEEALIREIREELRMEITPVRHLLSVPHRYDDFSILLHAWLCTCKNRRLVLQEHISCCWMHTGELHTLNWAAADLPIVRFLENFRMEGHPFVSEQKDRP